MGKNKYFSTKSVFGQLISLLDDSMISTAVKKHNSDRYVKHFKSQDHLFSMVYSCTTHDHLFLEKLKCDENTVYIFDKGYNDYKALEYFTQQKRGFVTRIKENAKYEVTQKNTFPKKIHSCVLSEEIIEVEIDKEGTKGKLKLRKIKYYDKEHKRTFKFISNLFEFRADTIATLYKIRWRIELLFK